MRNTAAPAFAAVLCAGLAACSLPMADSGPAPDQYLLTADFEKAGSPTRSAPVLMVARPRASAGYDSERMLYVEQTARLDSFARNRWAAPPAEMLEPLLVDALEATGAFQAVVDAGSGLGAGLRLDTEILKLQQEFLERPSRVRLVLRATLVDARSGRILFAETFQAAEPAPGNDPESGVEAANRVVKRVLTEIAERVAEHVRAPGRPGGAGAK